MPLPMSPIPGPSTAGQELPFMTSNPNLRMASKPTEQLEESEKDEETRLSQKKRSGCQREEGV